jgi:Flp pilus assembly protein TadG
MELRSNSVLRRALGGQRGQIVPWMALILLFFMGIAAFVIDVGRAVVAYHMLQAATDAAALAGAAVMPTATSSTQVTSEATAFSAVAGNKNANSALLPGAAMQTGYPKVYCSSTLTSAPYDVPCSTAAGGNALTVAQTVKLNTIFAGIVGIPTLTVNAASTAAMKGGPVQQYNIAVVLDTTASMASTDGSKNCPGTKIQCAEQGVQTLLANLVPCTATSTSTSCTAYDAVSIFTYPNIQASTVTQDTTCTSGNPSNLPYSTPTAGGTWTATNWTSTSPTYQITSYLSNWSSNNQKGGSYNNSSALTVAVGASTGSGCSSSSGMQAEGGEGTYFAGAVYAALSSLAAQQSANPGSKNALIILSDGDANATNTKTKTEMSPTGKYTSLNTNGTYPSITDECHQAITAAQTARTMTDSQGNLDTTVYTIAYAASNSSSGSCGTDTTGGEAISACDTLEQMASSPSDFFSDANSSCPAATTYGGIDQDFQAIAGGLSYPRLMPVNTP